MESSDTAQNASLLFNESSLSITEYHAITSENQLHQEMNIIQGAHSDAGPSKNVTLFSTVVIGRAELLSE